MAGDSSTGGLARRYAQALYELADSGKQLDALADDLRALKGMIAESEDLQRMIRSPLLSRDQQMAAMKAILEKAGSGELALRFVMVAAQNRRLFALPAMIDAYLSELARRRGEVTAQVTSAQEMTAAQEKALAAALDKAVGGKVQMDIKVDPALLGGLIVKVGSRMVDASVRSKLQRLQLAMKGVG